MQLGTVPLWNNQGVALGRWLDVQERIDVLGLNQLEAWDFTCVRYSTFIAAINASEERECRPHHAMNCNRDLLVI